MGKNFFDQYALLHFASGIVAYYWGFNLFWWFVLHSLFEIGENTAQGVLFINKYIPFWPGGKPAPDGVINSLGDTLFAILGWILSYYLDKYSTQKGLYFPNKL